MGVQPDSATLHTVAVSTTCDGAHTCMGWHAAAFHSQTGKACLHFTTRDSTYCQPRVLGFAHQLHMMLLRLRCCCCHCACCCCKCACCCCGCASRMWGCCRWLYAACAVQASQLLHVVSCAPAFSCPSTVDVNPCMTRPHMSVKKAITKHQPTTKPYPAYASTQTASTGVAAQVLHDGKLPLWARTCAHRATIV